MKAMITISAIVLLTGCLGHPESIKPVSGFELDRYLGKWYEVARLDHSFERGRHNVTAEYAMREDGGIEVINRAYHVEADEWDEAIGRAYFVERPEIGYIKVSFFGPFYGSYVIFELDSEGYQYAFVSGSSHAYLWLLARTPEVDEEVESRFIKQAGELGFDVSELIWVEHDR